MLSHIQKQRDYLLQAQHPFIVDAKRESNEANTQVSLVQADNIDTKIALSSHTFLKEQNN